MRLRADWVIMEGVTDVAVLGMGGMGSRIALRLIDSGHAVTVWNRSPARTEPLVAAGAKAASSPAEATASAEVVLTMLADPTALREVTEGPGGVAAGATERTTVIEMSTVGPEAIARFRGALPDGTQLLDAPVLGSLTEVEAGTLRIFVGGANEDVARWTPLLAQLGTPMHVGPLGSGAAAKLVANTALVGIVGVLGEALALGDAVGLERSTALDVLATTALASQVERRRASIESSDYPPRFPLALGRKDADLIVEAATAGGAELRVLDAARSWLVDAEAAGWGERDYAAVLAYILDHTRAAARSHPAGDPAVDLLDYWTPLLLRMIADAGVIAAFGDEERVPREVAAETGVDPEVLARVIRAAAGRGVFEHVEGGGVRLSALGRRLLPGRPGSVAGLANFKPFEIHAWAEAHHSLRTGEPSFPVHFGEGFWAWLASNPTSAAKFNDDMRRRVTMLLHEALPAFDWPQEGTVVDVGGGNGLLLERLLDHRPSLRGIVFDLPHVVAESGERFARAGLRERTEIVPGDFFVGVPEGHDIYVMSSVLHDWDDDDAVRILESCRRAMCADSRLVLFESVLRPGDAPDIGKMVDLHMLVLFGAKERTEAEWNALLGQAGFEVVRIVPTPGSSWIEARPTTD